MPLALLERTVVFVWRRVLGFTPPPQRLVRLLASSFPLARSEAGPSAARRWPARRKRLPFLTLTRLRTRRKRVRSLTAAQGRRFATRSAWRPSLRSRRRCALDAAADGSAFVCRASDRSGELALASVARASPAQAGSRSSSAAATAAAPGMAEGDASPPRMGASLTMRGPGQQELWTNVAG